MGKHASPSPEDHPAETVPEPREYPEAAPGQAGDDTPDDTADSLDDMDNLTLPDDDDDSELDTGA